MCGVLVCGGGGGEEQTHSLYTLHSKRTFRIWGKNIRDTIQATIPSICTLCGGAPNISIKLLNVSLTVHMCVIACV